VRSGGALIGLGLLSVPAQAINITYNFDDSYNSYDGLTSISKTVGGVTINLSNPNSNDGKFSVAPYGIVLSSGANKLTQFGISFSQSAQFISYEIGTYLSYNPPSLNRIFSLSNPDGIGSTDLLSFVGTGNFSNPFILNEGKTSTLSTPLTSHLYGSSIVGFKSITVDVADATAVPWETDALPVVGSTILFGFGVWAKRKSTKSLEK
jgi:hypothetical protein